MNECLLVASQQGQCVCRWTSPDTKRYSFKMNLAKSGPLNHGVTSWLCKQSNTFNTDFQA